MNTKVLKLAVATLTLIALAAISVPFFGSLGPTSRSLENAGQSGRAVDLGKLSPGMFLEMASDINRYFVVRDFEGEVRLFSVPYRQEMYWIADLRWDRPYMPCNDFGPDANGNKLVKNGAFRCRDERMSDWWRRESVWGYSGKNMGDQTGDMLEARYEIRGGTLFILGELGPLEDI